MSENCKTFSQRRRLCVVKTMGKLYNVDIVEAMTEIQQFAGPYLFFCIFVYMI